VATVPDTYIWDGDEYVGVVGSQYYYLGPGDVWLPFDAVRVVRFNDCQKKTHGLTRPRHTKRKIPP